MILLVFSEILLNFWEHAIEDTESIIVAHGNSQNIEIACADTGNGIISTLGGSMISENFRPEQILLESLKRGVTSKKMTNHMGYGLWILDQITTMVKGRLHIYSQGAYYYNEYGSKKSGRCGYWQGTIVYISLPLQKPKTLVDIEPLVSSEIKINWI
jgi:signal transduction histidine kinase